MRLLLVYWLTQQDWGSAEEGMKADVGSWGRGGGERLMGWSEFLRAVGERVKVGC